MNTAPVPPRLGRLIRRTLLIGVVAASLLLLLGLVLSVAAGVDSVRAPPDRQPLWSVPSELAKPGGEGLLLLGVLVLVFTPIVRVLLSLGAFAAAENVPFAVITLFVLVVLSAGLVLGLVP